jgi:hypothetical protein
MECEPPTDEREPGTGGAPIDSIDGDDGEADVQGALGAAAAAAARKSKQKTGHSKWKVSAVTHTPAPMYCTLIAQPNCVLGQAKMSFLSEVLRAAQQSGTDIETTAAAMRAAARRPATQPNRKHKPVPPLTPSTKVAVAVGAAILGDTERKHGCGGETPLASEEDSSFTGW